MIVFLPLLTRRLYKKTAEFFKKHPVDALGIGTFGPIDINPNSRTYGYILDTPKPGWSGTDVKGFFERELGIPVAMTTDVNASCYGEYVARGRMILRATSMQQLVLALELELCKRVSCSV